MPLKTEKDLPENLRGSWLKALTAIELKNYGYAISLLQAILKEAPEFLDGRKFLRQAEIAKNKGKRGLLGGFSGASISAMKIQSQIKKDPLAAIVAAEKLLEGDPLNVQAGLALKDAALAANMPETAIFAMESLKDANPKDTKILHTLGRLYYEQGQAQKAVAIFTLITEINPSDLDALKLGKDASAAASMTGGGWESAESYRDLIKDKEEAISLEQKNRFTKSEDVIEQQLIELGQRYNEQPENIDVSRQIAGLYEQKGDLENALTWYQYTSTLTQGSDPVITRKITDLELKQLDARVEELNLWLSQVDESHEEVPRVREELQSLAQRQAEAVLGDAKRRVERNPTDLQLRLEYGEQLMNAGYFAEAIPELQQARRSPSARYRAMLLLGRAYVHKNMLDLAAKQLEEAANELKGMDDNKKQIVYQLGLVYELMGRSQDYVNCMKQIYEVDYGYLDVATRVESSYQKSSES